MPNLLPEGFVEMLRLDSTVALAAGFVIANHHPEILQYAASLVEAPAAAAPRVAKAKRPRRVPIFNGSVDYSDRRRERRDYADKRLLEAMKPDSGGSINDWAAAIGKSRSSTVTALRRLRDAGLADCSRQVVPGDSARTLASLG
jgi:hypothetical protein